VHQAFKLCYCVCCCCYAFSLSAKLLAFISHSLLCCTWRSLLPYICLLTKHNGWLLWVADVQLMCLYHRPVTEHMRPSMYRCQHVVKRDEAWLCTICSALSACRIGIGNDCMSCLNRGSLTAYRSPPEVIKVCIEPDILVFADLQQLCCCCLRRSICRFCGCCLHGDLSHKVSKKTVLQHRLNQTCRPDHSQKRFSS